MTDENVMVDEKKISDYTHEDLKRLLDKTEQVDNNWEEVADFVDVVSPRPESVREIVRTWTQLARELLFAEVGRRTLAKHEGQRLKEE